MKKTAFVLFGAAFFATAAVSCTERVREKSDTMSIRNALTEEEKKAGILTPEVMWKMGRVGGSVLSPDGATVLYTVTSYDMAENKGTTDVWSVPSAGGKAVLITDPGSNESSVQWSADGGTIYFLSDRSGSSQIWSAAPSGNNLRQVSDVPGGVEGFAQGPEGGVIPQPAINLKIVPGVVSVLGGRKDRPQIKGVYSQGPQVWDPLQKLVQAGNGGRFRVILRCAAEAQGIDVVEHGVVNPMTHDNPSFLRKIDYTMFKEPCHCP